jgi:hypothetical protein
VVDQGIRTIDISESGKYLYIILMIFTYIKIDTSLVPNPALEMLLDAETVDVYRGTHAMVLLIDVTREETFDYAKHILETMPDGLSVLILGNFSSQNEKRVITPNMIKEMLDEIQEQKSDEFIREFIRYSDADLKEGIGLDYLHRFIGIPFLTVQINTLRMQLSQRTNELKWLLNTIDHQQQSQPPQQPQSPSSLPPIDIHNEWSNVEFKRSISLTTNEEEKKQAEALEQRRQKQNELLHHVSNVHWDQEQTETGSQPLFSYYGEEEDHQPNPLVAAEEKDVTDDEAATIQSTTDQVSDFVSTSLVAVYEQPIPTRAREPSLDVLIHQVSNTNITESSNQTTIFDASTHDEDTLDFTAKSETLSPEHTFSEAFTEPNPWSSEDTSKTEPTWPQNITPEPSKRVSRFIQQGFINSLFCHRQLYQDQKHLNQKENQKNIRVKEQFNKLYIKWVEY